MRHRREQDLAAEASVERIQVELADRCFGDGIGLRVPPRRADELRHEQLVEVRISLPIDLVKRLLEDGKGIRDPVREPERAAQLERDRAAPRRVGEELETGAQVVGRSRAVRPPLRKAELDQHLCPRGRIDLLVERAGEISDRGLGRALGERALGRLAERRDHERVGPWGDAEQVPGRTLRRRAGLEQQLSGRAVRGVSFDHIERLVDGAADDGVEELERILATEEVEPNEGGGGRTKLACFHAGERGRVAQLGPVAEDRGRAEEGQRLRRQASEAKPDDARNALRADLQQTGHVLGGRAGSLPCNRVEHRADEERISAGRRLEGGAEGVVRLQAVQLAREHGDRGTPKRFGANRGGLRIGDQLCDKGGIVALSLGRPGSGGDEERHSLEPSRQVEEPPQGGSVRPVQVVDREQRRPLKGHVGREPVEAVEDREGALCGRVRESRRAARLRTAARRARQALRAAPRGDPERRTRAAARTADGRSRTQTRPRTRRRGRRALASPPSRQSRAPRRAGASCRCRHFPR